jgi:hypothetical protein
VTVGGAYHLAMGLGEGGSLFLIVREWRWGSDNRGPPFLIVRGVARGSDDRGLIVAEHSGMVMGSGDMGCSMFLGTVTGFGQRGAYHS